MPPRSITMLSNLQTAELTLTKRGANDRRFAMTKGGIPMDPEVLKNLIATPAEGEDQFLAILKSQGITDEDKVNAAVASYRMQKGMKDLVSDDVMAAVAKSAGYEGTAKAVTPNEGKDDKKPDATSGKVDPKAKAGQGPVKKVDLSDLDDATRVQVEAVFKSNAAMEERTATLETVVKSLQDEKVETHYVAKAAKSYSHLPLGERQLGLMLKSANDHDPAFAKGFEELLGRMDEMVEKSNMLTVMGAVNKANDGGGWDKIQALANGIVQKSTEAGKSVSDAQAIDLVLKTAQGKALYREYLGDNPKQRAEVY